MRKGTFDCIQARVKVLFEVGNGNRGDSEGRSIVNTTRYRRPRMTDATHLVDFVEPAVMHKAELMTERQISAGGRVVRVKFQRILEKLSPARSIGVGKRHHMR